MNSTSTISIKFVIPFLFFSHFVFAQNDYKQLLNLSYVELDSLANNCFQYKKYKDAIPIAKAIISIVKKEKNDTLFAEWANNLGLLYKLTGNYELAIPLYIQAKDLREKLLGRESPEFVTSLYNLAFLYENKGNYELAIPLYIESKNIGEKIFGNEHPKFAASLRNLANLYQKIGNYELALPPLIQSMNIYEKVLGNQHPLFAESLNNLAHLYHRIGNYELALLLYTKSLDIDKKNSNEENTSSIARSLNNLAALHESIGKYELALPLYRQSVNMYEKILETEDLTFSTLLGSLAHLYHMMGNYELALPLFIQAKNISEKVLGNEHPEFALSLNNLAGLYQDMGKYELALPLFIQAKNIREKTLGAEYPNFARSLNNLAGIHRRMGNYELAWNNIHQVINNMSRLQINHTFSEGWLDSLKIITYTSNRDIEEIVAALAIAYQLLKEDSSVVNPQIKQLYVVDLAVALLGQARNHAYSEKDKLRFLELSDNLLQKSLTILSPEQNTPKAFSLADQNKSVLLLQTTKSEEAYRLGELPDSLARKDKELLAKQSELQAKLLEKRSNDEKDSLRNELIHVNQSIDIFGKVIEKNFPKYYKLKYNQAETSVEDIQVLLDDNTALVEYVIGDSVVHIFCIDKKEAQWTKSFVSNKKLNDNIKTLHQSLSSYALVTKNKKKAYRSYTENAHWFYQLLIASVLKDKKGINNLIIVSDGELGHLPFETFLVEQAPQTLTDYKQLHYLVNDYNISYNYSATLWKENKAAPAPKNNGQILGVAANYDLKLDSALMDVRLPTDQWLRNTLSPLPAARKEVETLQEKYQGFFAFDALASEKTVKAKANDFAILHFATHGILDNKRPVLSSLAMSEDNDSTESNFWQAHEISKLELNANLVVLSACETGYGKFEKGNGIASLARAFMYAGASSLIVSLWQVNDYATSEIMKNLYANLSNGMKKDEALKQAKLQYIKSAKGVLAHPAFWSPFIMMGNTEPVNIKRKGSTMPWVMGGLLVVFVLGGGFMMSKQKKEVV